MSTRNLFGRKASRALSELSGGWSPVQKVTITKKQSALTMRS
jgi:hypothetical protein